MYLRRSKADYFRPKLGAICAFLCGPIRSVSMIVVRLTGVGTGSAPRSRKSYTSSPRRAPHAAATTSNLSEKRPRNHKQLAVTTSNLSEITSNWLETHKQMRSAKGTYRQNVARGRVLEHLRTPVITSNLSDSRMNRKQSICHSRPPITSQNLP